VGHVNVQEMVAEADVGAREPKGITGKVILGVALLWSLFQLWYAAPLQYMLGFGIFDSTEARSVHLGFALFLTFIAYPAATSSPRDRVPVLDWVFACVGAFAGSYLFLFKNELALRPGLPTDMDMVTAVIGVVLLLEATRRALGPPLMIVAIVFLAYTFLGPHMPDVVAHKGASLDKGVSHYWLTTEGVFGVAINVSTSMVFLFVLFGALLEKAGAGNYFIQVAFAFLGHLRGGPAKAAVVSSGMTGLISGSSIANVVTTGTFTIPLMKKVGFPGEKAGAVEVASSTNGQLTPPIMGAAAFLMVEYVGIPYIDVITHALLPALISYIALIYIVHLEALKAGMKGLPKNRKLGIVQRLIGMLTGFLLVGITAVTVYFGLGWMKDVFGGATVYVATAVILLAYVALVKLASYQPPLKGENELDELPDPGPTVKAGLHFLLPVVVLVWCLTVEHLSPGLSAFWATVLMSFIVVTLPALEGYFRKQNQRKASGTGTLKKGFFDLVDGLITGGRNMIGIGVATAAAGIVVGTVTLTGIGQVMTEFVEYISAGSLILMLVFTAGISLILGMGLPTTANYIVVSSLMAPVIVSLGSANGLEVPLIAAHMFVFYFGILADDTPPVGLAAFAAAAIAKSDPIRTGLQGFAYDIRTAILPFLFIFNSELLLIGVDSITHAILVFASALIAMIAFAAATQRFFVTRCSIAETVVLLLVAFTMFRPGYWLDQIEPEYDIRPASALYATLDSMPQADRIRLMVKGETLEGDEEEKLVALPIDTKGTARDRIESSGILLKEGDAPLMVDMVTFDSPAQKLGIDFDYEITKVYVSADRMPKEMFYIPALILLAGVYLLQRRRSKLAA
jgi:TRAP transporter 4TM/12TM fusion protein